jgi:methyl-accepting chemotaxis protein
MIDAIAVFRDNILEADRLNALQSEEQAIKNQRAERLERLSRDFENSVDQALCMLGTAATALSETAKRMAENANLGSRQAGIVAAAAEKIAAHVTAMQEATRAAVSAIEKIDGTISQMNEISTSIAAAMEEQGAATSEIARNVQEAARGTADVTGNVVGLNEVTSETGRASSEVLDAAALLGSQAEHLRHGIDSYLMDVAAA